MCCEGDGELFCISMPIRSQPFRSKSGAIMLCCVSRSGRCSWQGHTRTRHFATRVLTSKSQLGSEPIRSEQGSAHVNGFAAVEVKFRLGHFAQQESIKLGSQLPHQHAYATGSLELDKFANLEHTGFMCDLQLLCMQTHTAEVECRSDAM